MMDPKIWKNDQKDTMWRMFEMGGIKYDKSQSEYLKKNVDTLIAATKQKTSG